MIEENSIKIINVRNTIIIKHTSNHSLDSEKEEKRPGVFSLLVFFSSEKKDIGNSSFLFFDKENEEEEKKEQKHWDE